MALYRPTRTSFKKAQSYSLPKGVKASSPKIKSVKSPTFKASKVSKPRVSARKVKI